MNSMYKKLISIALPITIGGLITASINLTDVFLIGKLGGNAIAAVGLANQIMLLFMITLFGINNAGVIFVSQYFGNNDTGRIKKIAALCFCLVFAVTAVFMACAFFIPGQLMRIYTADPVVADLAAGYLRIVAVSYLFTALSVTTSQLLSGMSRTKEAMYAGFAALVINISLNYLLIFGNFGFPRLGIPGAAVATVISRIIECIIICCLAKLKAYPVFFKLRDLTSINIAFLKNYIKTGLPVMGSYTFWVLGATTLTAIYARIGTEAIVAMNIFNSIEKIAYTGVVALSSASGIIIGQELGRKNIKKAARMAGHLNLTGFGAAVILASVLAVSTFFIIRMYNITPGTALLTKKIMWLFCLVFPFATINSINMIGTLRAGGQTDLIFIFDLICMWGTSVPLAFLGYKLKIPMEYVYILAIGGGEAVKLTLSMMRVVSLKWAKSLT